MAQLPLPASGRIVGPCHYYALRVFYEDTDLSGIVYHANYLKFCERARSDILQLLEIDQRAAQEAGEGAYAVADAQIVWKRPARLGDGLLVETRATSLRAASVRMYQRILRPAADAPTTLESAEVLAEVDLRIGFVSPDGRPRRQPDDWRAKFARFAEGDEF
tara:strand:+ start:26007 stop:26492 length:486 start_codon:yes stop_codon:yes gene_type:complete